jgi:hypothetical protein
MSWIKDHFSRRDAEAKQGEADNREAERRQQLAQQAEERARQAQAEARRPGLWQRLNELDPVPLLEDLRREVWKSGEIVRDEIPGSCVVYALKVTYDTSEAQYSWTPSRGGGSRYLGSRTVKRAHAAVVGCSMVTSFGGEPIGGIHCFVDPHRDGDPTPGGLCSGDWMRLDEGLPPRQAREEIKRYLAEAAYDMRKYKGIRSYLKVTKR